MPAAPPVSQTEAQAFLRSWTGDEVTDVELAGEGTWSRCYGFGHDGRDLVARFGHHVEDFRRDQFAAQWSSRSMPVPVVLDIVEDAAWWVAISTRVHGQPLESLDAAGWRAVLPPLLAALDAMRNVDLSDTGGFGPWDGEGRGLHRSWSETLLSVIDDGPGPRTPGWRAAIAADATAEGVFTAGAARLVQLADACPLEQRHLIHDDLLYRNVLVQEGRTTGVFDWGCSLYGDHLADLAHLLFWAPWYPALDALDLGTRAAGHHDVIGLAVPDRDARILACQLRLGLGALGYSAATGDPSVSWVTERVGQVLES